ncbi:fructose-bisphosphatase class III [Schlesneria sp. DSM 10557]|uniref:fructose-bisphosphatase class III n=1 Tax=Schlesneria sp. DSM 10557 TaxID=3044399 RepID=UPI0035A0B0A7
MNVDGSPITMSGTDHESHPCERGNCEERPRRYELTLLRALATQFPNIDSALAEIARLSAVLTLPKGTVHVISDIHGEHKKLRHVINNASGTLRPLVERLFKDRMDPKEFTEFLTLIFYPAEVTAQLEKKLTDPDALRCFARKTLRHQFELVRVLASNYSLKRATQVFPQEYANLFAEMLHEPSNGRGQEFVDAVVDEMHRRGRALHLIHITGRLIRNLAIYELIIAGDCWDRGPRGDRVVDYLRDQPNVSFIWGNHDVAWLGAGLGHEALIAHVLRVSLRYRRLGQLDEGYSIPLTPLEHLARTVYGDDPAAHFMPKSSGMRSDLIVARMQKAAAIMQFKLEGQMIARNPEWELDHRRLLHHINQAEGTVTVDGVKYALRDNLFPTLDPEHPYELTPQEELCMARLKYSFVNSQTLNEQLRYLVSHGAMYLRRDEHLIFHGCVPCTSEGEFLPMPVDGKLLSGRALFDSLERVIAWAMEQRQQRHLDVLWYLWSGPRSPLFGKDRIATFERDFIADKTPHHETKDPYFNLVDEPWFCEKVLTEFGVNCKQGLIVNGHVPVKIDAAESPLKKSGKAITIDGAFSEAYGDHGYTLVLGPEKTLLAKHHHFESVESAVRDGIDIVPSVSVIREWDRPRRMSDTERGEQFRCDIEMLERLIELYRNNELAQDEWRPKLRS